MPPVMQSAVDPEWPPPARLRMPRGQMQRKPSPGAHFIILFSGFFFFSFPFKSFQPHDFKWPPSVQLEISIPRGASCKRILQHYYEDHRKTTAKPEETLVPP